MDELRDNLIWIEKYRPKNFEDLILENKSLILNFLKNPQIVPSFIFYSNKPGTGKTSTAKIIINYLKCDSIIINSSDERGIDTIRDKIKLFASALSSISKVKRCIFLDEADSMTRTASDSLRNIIETYSDNVFFIFSCNDLGKIIEPIRSRCTLVNFERPNKADIIARLLYISEKEELKWECNVENFVDFYYPDVRSMIVKMNEAKIDNKSISLQDNNFMEFLNLIVKKDIPKVYERVYSGDFPILNFNKWMMKYLFDKYDNFIKKYGQIKLTKIVMCLADNEKYWNMGANTEVLFMSNILQIMEIL